MTRATFNGHKAIESFVCALYGMHDCVDTNVARTKKILNLMKPIARSPDRLKKVDCGLLSPCKKVLENKIKRTQLIARWWYNADTANPSLDLNPLNFGWCQEGNPYNPHWYSSSALPNTMDLKTQQESDPESESEDFNEVDAEWTDSSEDEAGDSQEEIDF